MIQVTARIDAHPAGRRELAQALLHWAEIARRDGKAAAAHVYEDVESSQVFLLVAEWGEPLLFEAHVSSPTFGALVGAVELLAASSWATVTAAEGDEPRTTLRRLRASCGGVSKRRSSNA